MQQDERYSAALCRGLIEIAAMIGGACSSGAGIPRLYAAASLKFFAALADLKERLGYSAALCRGLIEILENSNIKIQEGIGYSAALCRGLIEMAVLKEMAEGDHAGIPRLYAAASLKLEFVHDVTLPGLGYSAALCRGLIEISCRIARRPPTPAGIPRLYAAASLK